VTPRSLEFIADPTKGSSSFSSYSARPHLLTTIFFCTDLFADSSFKLLFELILRTDKMADTLIKPEEPENAG
jgi:hypothetical protein